MVCTLGIWMNSSFKALRLPMSLESSLLLAVILRICRFFSLKTYSGRCWILVLLRSSVINSVKSPTQVGMASIWFLASKSSLSFGNPLIHSGKLFSLFFDKSINLSFFRSLKLSGSAAISLLSDYSLLSSFNFPNSSGSFLILL